MTTTFHIHKEVMQRRISRNNLRFDEDTNLQKAKDTQIRGNKDKN